MYPFNPEPNLWVIAATEWTVPIVMLVGVMWWRAKSSHKESGGISLALLLVIFLSYFWVAWAASEFRFGKVGTKGEWFLPCFWVCCGVSLQVVSYLYRRHMDAWQKAASGFGLAIGLLTSLALAATCPIEGTRRSQCRNNLKQIGLALHNYLDTYESFPAQSEGNPAVSWRVAVLPYMDQAPLYNEYDKSLAWNTGTNELVAKMYIRELSCPTTPPGLRQGDYPFTAYTLPYGRETCWAPNAYFRFDEITDGASSTILVVEACGQQIPWAEPRDVPLLETPVGFDLPGNEPNRSEGLLSSYHPGGGSQVLFADGRVRYLNKDVDPDILKALLTPDGGEVVPEF